MEAIETAENLLVERDLPKGAKTLDQREEIVKMLVPLVRQAEADRDQGEERRNILDDFYQDNASDYLDKPWDSAIEHHIPLIGPKIDALVSHVCTPILSQEPICIAKVAGMGAEYKHDLERVIHSTWETAEFGRHLKQAVKYAAIHGKSIIRASFEAHAQGFLPNRDETISVSSDGPVAFAGPVFEVITWRNFVVFPTNVSSIPAAKFAGHRFVMRVQEVKEMQKAGLYLDDEEPKPTAPKQSGTGNELSQPGMAQAVSDDDKPCECYELIVKLDLDGDGYEERYRVVLDATNHCLYDIELWPYSQPPYFDVFLHEEDDRFWPDTSRANRLQGLQIATNCTVSLLDWGSQMGAFPTQFADGWSLPENYAKSKPGQVVPVEAGGAINGLASNFDPAAFPLLLQFFDERADIAARISNNGLGQSVTYGGGTATEANLRQQGQDVGVMDDIQYISLAVARLASFTQELLLKHFPLMRQVYQDAFPCDDAQKLRTPARWEVNGKTPDNTPFAISQQAQGLATMLGTLGLPPPVIIEIVKSIIQGSNLPNKDKVMEFLTFSQQVPNGQQTTDPALQQPGMGVPDGGSQNPMLALMPGA